MLTKMIPMALLGIILGPILSIVITPLVCLLRKVFVLPIIRPKIRKKVLEKGHIVTAHLIRQNDILNDNGTVSCNEIAVYQYEYNNITYKYKSISAGTSSKEIELYFMKNPRKATTYNEIGLKETHWLKYYLLISVLIAIIVTFVGVKYV